MSMMFYIITLITGFFIGYFIKGSIKSKSSENRFLRRGLYRRSYSVRRMGSIVGEVDATFEVGEVESTNKLSKIEVISVITDKSEYNSDPSERKKLSSMIQDSWVDSNEIEWINTTASDRNKKIDEILS